MSQRRLYVGLDIRNDISQIAVLGPMLQEPEILDPGGNENGIDYPTRVAVPGTKEYIEGFLEKIYRQEPVVAAGRETDPVNILAAFFRKILSKTRKKYPNESIRQLVVTTEYRDYRLIGIIYQALAKIGIHRDRAMVIDRRQSFIYYVLSQKKELWINHVGVFDYTKDRLMYLQMETDRYKRPMLAAVEERDYSDYIPMFQEKDSTEEEKNSIFEGMVQGAIHGKIITTLYMTGNGFEGGFAGAVMKKLCVGRHLFQGDNLYVAGACYCAREMSGERRLEEFVYLDEDTVEVNISINVYTDGKPQEILLVRAGTPWHQIDHEIDLIPDGDRELELNVKNMRTKDKAKQCIPMEGIPGRTDRKARIGLQMRFAGKEKCIVTVRDKGFGDFYPSSCRIWEKTITIE